MAAVLVAVAVAEYTSPLENVPSWRQSTLTDMLMTDLLIIFSNVPNVGAGYGAPDMLKLIKDVSEYYIFDDLAQITHDSKWKDYSPQFVRNCLIRTLFFAGYSLEDIMYITGINIKNISKYISMDELLQRRSNKINWKPLFDGLLCESK